MPDESTCLWLRHRLEKIKFSDQILALFNDLLIERDLLLKTSPALDATLMAGHAPPKTTTTPAPLRWTSAKTPSNGTLPSQHGSTPAQHPLLP
jgi:hypothetical protein